MNDTPLHHKNKRQKRLEDFGISFSNAIADGWAFDVPEAFRDVMDIKLVSYVDKEHSTKKNKVYRDVWTRGNPPVLRFSRGHIFYDPPGCRTKTWQDALRVLRRIVRVVDATPDQIDNQTGTVRFEETHYKNGKKVRSVERTCSQSDFEKFLKYGVI